MLNLLEIRHLGAEKNPAPKSIRAGNAGLHNCLDFFDHPFFPKVLEPLWYLAGPGSEKFKIGPDNGHPPF